MATSQRLGGADVRHVGGNPQWAPRALALRLESLVRNQSSVWVSSSRVIPSRPEVFQRRVEIRGQFNLAGQGAGTRSNACGGCWNWRGPDHHHVQLARERAGGAGAWMFSQPWLSTSASMANVFMVEMIA